MVDAAAIYAPAQNALHQKMIEKSFMIASALKNVQLRDTLSRLMTETWNEITSSSRLSLELVLLSIEQGYDNSLS